MVKSATIYKALGSGPVCKLFLSLLSETDPTHTTPGGRLDDDLSSLSF